MKKHLHACCAGLVNAAAAREAEVAASVRPLQQSLAEVGIWAAALHVGLFAPLCQTGALRQLAFSVPLLKRLRVGLLCDGDMQVEAANNALRAQLREAEGLKEKVRHRGAVGLC